MQTNEASVNQKLILESYEMEDIAYNFWGAVPSSGVLDLDTFFNQGTYYHESNHTANEMLNDHVEEEVEPNPKGLDASQPSIRKLASNTSCLKPHTTEKGSKDKVAFQSDPLPSDTIKPTMATSSSKRLRNRTSKVTQRDETTISKVLFTPLKQLLKKFNGFQRYFNLRSYGINHRPLIDYYYVDAFVEQLEKQSKGERDRFQLFLDDNYAVIEAYGQKKYEGKNNLPRLNVYKTYLDRIYALFRCRGTEEDKLTTLYNTNNIRVDVRAKVASFKLKLDELFEDKFTN